MQRGVDVERHLQETVKIKYHKRAAAGRLFLCVKGGEIMGKVNKQAITDADLELINRYTRKEYTADELYAFEMRAADTRIDRDFECFDRAALEKMAELYVGKTVICDHAPSAYNQCARIFKGRVQEAEDGASELILTAYLPREGNDELIGRLDSGIVKEISVGCAVRKRSCSVCGKERETCRHKKGKMYGDKLCSFVLSDIADVYEVSFVAVPAQRAAGVIKCHKSFNEPDEPLDEGAYQEDRKSETAVALGLAAAEIFINEEFE